MLNAKPTVERDSLELNFQGVKFRYDPAASHVIYAQVSNPTQLLPVLEDAFWADVIRYSLVAVVLAHKNQKGVPEVHVNDMIHALCDLEHLRDLIITIAPSGLSEATAEIEWLKSYLMMWHDEGKNAWYSERYRSIHQGAVAKFTSQRDAA